MPNNRSANAVLSLIKLALDSGEKDYSPEFDDWESIYEIADAQGVLAIIYDVIEKLPAEARPDMEWLMEWIGQVNIMEYMYEQHKTVIGKLADFYNSHGIKMMLLKGYGLSLNYPNPNHRPVGDIDSYNFGQWQKADKVLHEELGIEIDNSHHHHTVFKFEGVTVENHYEFINTKGHRSSVAFEKRLEELSQKPCDILEVGNSKISIPHPDFNALFILRHCAGHFRATQLTLRQLLDWLLFVKKEHKRINWDDLYTFLKKMNLNRFANCLNAIGVKYLGFEKDLFPEIEKDDKLVDRVLNDILSPEFTEREDGTVIGGLRVKPRRWWHNRWKQRICFPDSLLSDFIHQFYAKLLKPAHFRD